MKILKREYLIGLGIPTVFVPGLILAAVLGWNWERDLGKIGGGQGLRQSEIIFPKKAIVSEVYDGDTFLLQSGQTVRLLGINAPDRGQDGYETSRQYLQKMINGEEVRLEYDKYQDDKFGRILAYAFEKCMVEPECTNGERMVNLVLIKDKMARTVFYKDRGKLKYQTELQEAE